MLLLIVSNNMGSLFLSFYNLDVHVYICSDSYCFGFLGLKHFYVLSNTTVLILLLR
jgi:hypothetical protein